VFCFHFAGGSASQFRPWDGMISNEIEILGVQLPGREARYHEPPMRDLAALIKVLGPALTSYIDRPFALFGHSLGALIAFEFARWLRRNSHPAPSGLFVASQPAPQLPRTYAPTHDLPEAELLDVLRMYGGTTESVLTNSQVMQIFLPTIRADLEMNRMYEYAPDAPLACTIDAFCGEADPICSEHAILAWKEQALSRFRCHFFPGGHFFFQKQPNLILSSLTEHLRNRQAGIKSIGT
jgi:medium-chain acyl-[acyl-carrier-protein] hydrolase